MPRPAKKTKKPPHKKASPLSEAARQVAIDAGQVTQDLNKLLLSLEGLSVEALREVSNRSLALIAERTGGEKRSVADAVLGGALSIGQSVSRLFSKSEPAAKKRGARKAAAKRG